MLKSPGKNFNFVSEIAKTSPISFFDKKNKSHFGDVTIHWWNQKEIGILACLWTTWQSHQIMKALVLSYYNFLQSFSLFAIFFLSSCVEVISLFSAIISYHYLHRLGYACYGLKSELLRFPYVYCTTHSIMNTKSNIGLGFQWLQFKSFWLFIIFGTRVMFVLYAQKNLTETTSVYI